jgi:hypothetical protein
MKLIFVILFVGVFAALSTAEPSTAKCSVCSGAVEKFKIELQKMKKAISDFLGGLCKNVKSEDFKKNCKGMTDGVAKIIFGIFDVNNIKFCRFLNQCPKTSFASLTSSKSFAGFSSNSYCETMRQFYKEADENEMSSFCEMGDSKLMQFGCNLLLQTFSLPEKAKQYAHEGLKKRNCNRRGLGKREIRSVDLWQAAEEEEDGLGCKYCKKVLNFVLVSFLEDDFKETLLNEAKMYCKSFKKPGTIQECIQLVDISTQDVIKQIMKYLDPLKSCQAMKACKAAEKPAEP